MTGVIGPHVHVYVQALPDLAIGPKASSQLSLGLVLRPKHYNFHCQNHGKVWSVAYTYLLGIATQGLAWVGKQCRRKRVKQTKKDKERWAWKTILLATTAAPGIPRTEECNVCGHSTRNKYVQSLKITYSILSALSHLDLDLRLLRNRCQQGRGSSTNMHAIARQPT